MIKYYKRILFIFFSLLFITHFTLTIISVSPNSYIKNKMLSFCSLYLKGPFFQRWQLFAPNPMVHNIDFYVNCYLNNYDPGEWINISNGMKKSLNENIFGSYVRIHRLFTVPSIYQLQDLNNDNQILINFTNSICYSLNKNNNLKFVQYKFYVKEIEGFDKDNKKNDIFYISKKNNFQIKGLLNVKKI